MEPHVPQSVGVYGGGRMGAGIAHAFLLAGASVSLLERDADAAAAARDRVVRSLSRSAARGGLDVDAADHLDRLSVGDDVSQFAGVELVVEAVPEDFELKREVLRAAQRAAPSALLATNTSSLSVTDLARSLERPAALIGLHFFNPVPVSDLVEIIVGDHTAESLVDLARSWVAGLGKTGIVVRDVPGFATSRLGVAIALEAIRMVEEGVASAEDIDHAMTLGYRHQMGPLRTTDIVGLDVRLSIADHLARELGPRFEAPELLRSMVSEGAVGRKAGRGFYTW